MEQFIKRLEIQHIDKEKINHLKNLIKSVCGSFYIIEPKKNYFKFPYLLYIPNQFDSTTLIMHGNNLALEEGNILNIYSAIFETTSEAGYDLLSLNQPILVPITSNYIHPANNNMHEFFPLQASRNVLFCKDSTNTYYKLFEQINNMIEDAQNIIKSKYNVHIDDKIICHGFSSSSKFVLRYATCYPSKVSLLIAGGFGNQAILPLENITINNTCIDLIYPVGIKDIKYITGKDFDKSSFYNLKQFYFIGELEDSSNDTAFNFRHTDPDIQEIYKNVFGFDYQSRFDQLKTIFKELNYTNVEFIRYANFGHSATPGISHSTELIKNYRKIE